MGGAAGVPAWSAPAVSIMAEVARKQFLSVACNLQGRVIVTDFVSVESLTASGGTIRRQTNPRQMPSDAKRPKQQACHAATGVISAIKELETLRV